MLLDPLIRHRRALHQIPELKFDLPLTQSYVLNALKGLGCAVSAVAGNGVLAYFDAGKDETVAFRADMDALPVSEATDCAFASHHPGQMHACGHDGHMAMLLTLAEWLSDAIHALPPQCPSDLPTRGGKRRGRRTGRLERLPRNLSRRARVRDPRGPRPARGRRRLAPRPAHGARPAKSILISRARRAMPQSPVRAATRSRPRLISFTAHTGRRSNCPRRSPAA